MIINNINVKQNCPK